MSPVTHTALVAVNNAVNNEAEPGPSRAIGSISSPVTTATANAVTITWAGWRNLGNPRCRPGAHTPIFSLVGHAEILMK